MHARDYQQAAARTLIDAPPEPWTDQECMLIWCQTGLSGEVGEVSELIKKGIMHGHGIDIEKLSKELGDVCWYLAGICTVMGLSLEDVMDQNIHKLLARYPNGFSQQDSILRKDVEVVRA